MGIKTQGHFSKSKANFQTFDPSPKRKQKERQRSTNPEKNTMERRIRRIPLGPIGAFQFQASISNRSLELAPSPQALPLPKA